MNLKILIAGDSGQASGVRQVDEWMGKEGIIQGVILGDVWDVNTNVKNGTIAIIRGNHEIEKLWAGKKFGYGIVPHQDYTKFELGGKVFGVIGRMDEKAHQHLLKDGWHLGNAENRAFTHHTMDVVRSYLKNTDILLTHDGPYPFLLRDSAFEGAEVRGSLYLRDVLYIIQPKYNFHGHFHRYQERTIADVRVFGMPCSDPTFNNRGYAILDTETMDVEIKLMEKFQVQKEEY